LQETTEPREPAEAHDALRNDSKGSGRERMSDAEAIMWAVEKDPALRSDFCNLSILERAPDPKRLRAKIDDVIRAMPRLGQRVVSAPLRIAPPEWVDDPSLDLEYHLRHVSLPAPGDERALLDLCASLAEAPFDRGRPLWEFTIIDGLENGRVAMLQKLHHTITDGVGGLKLSLALVDFEADPIAETQIGEARISEARISKKGPADRAGHGVGGRSPSPLDVARAAAHDAAAKQVSLAKQTIEGAAHLATHPLEVPGAICDAARLAASVRRQVLVTESAYSDVLNVRSLRRHFELFEVEMPALREAARTLGGSINDVFVTAIAGALGEYHAARGSDVRDLRMAMPVSTRQRGDQGANRFAPLRVVIPIQPADVLPRFAATRAALDAAKGERALGAIDRLAGLASGLPTSLLVAFTRAQTRTIDFATSNLRGSPAPLYLAGAPIEGNFPLGPRTGCAVNVTMLSYRDRCQLGFNLDPAAIVAPEEFMAAVSASFAEVIEVAEIASAASIVTKV
jgi:WS/DGAT/MGAT family acyltransferase